ncbi:MAG: HEPN domain-containing protein [Bdellovibrio sp.]
MKKPLKGYLTYKKIPFEKTHDVKILSEVFLRNYPELESLVKESTQLTKYAVLHRYPDADIPEPTKIDCQNAIKCAQKVLEEIHSRIPFDSLFKI